MYWARADFLTRTKKWSKVTQTLAKAPDFIKGDLPPILGKVYMQFEGHLGGCQKSPYFSLVKSGPYVLSSGRFLDSD
jgi:hypothetical protein